jgi:glycosyltransferase involved in cell wall biosynthesis
MKKPKLSICIPTYNRGEIVKKTIENILTCKEKDIEVVVSNNGSTDNTDELIRSISDDRLKYIGNKQNQGFTYNLLKVIEFATADFVFLLSDEDDLILEPIKDIINIIERKQDVSAILGSVYDKRNNYLIKYKNRTYKKGKIAFQKHSFSHQYMSGMILNKNLIDFDNLWIEQNKIKKGFLDIYPHVYILNNLCYMGDVVTLKQIICKQRDIGKPSEDIIGENAYIMPIERINLFQKNIESLSYYSINSKIVIQTFIKLYLWTLNQILSYNNILKNKEIADYFKVISNNNNLKSDLDLLNIYAFNLIETTGLRKNQKAILEKKIKLSFKKQLKIHNIKRLIKNIIKPG